MCLSFASMCVHVSEVAEMEFCLPVMCDCWQRQHMYSSGTYDLERTEREAAISSVDNSINSIFFMLKMPGAENTKYSMFFLN